MNNFYVRLNKTTFNIAEMLFKKPFLYSYLFSAPAQYIKTFIFATVCKSTQLFFGSTEQERNYGGHELLEKFFVFRGKKC